jgi:elongation factor P
MPDGGGDFHTSLEKWLAVGVNIPGPPGGSVRHSSTVSWLVRGGAARDDLPRRAIYGHKRVLNPPGAGSNLRKQNVKVIASSIRKGNIIEREDGNLYVVLSAESFFPGKGTPTTQIDMRRLSDGVKTTDRYKTTEQVERAFVEDQDFSYLYADDDAYAFMNQQSFDQVTVPKDVIGDQAQWLQEGMVCILSMFNGVPVAIQLPQRVTLEVTETEPAMKGQTASSSYKPAIVSNGARVMVPPHIQTGTRIVIQTEDGTYVERAKD